MPPTYIVHGTFTKDGNPIIHVYVENEDRSLRFVNSYHSDLELEFRLGHCDLRKIEIVKK